MIQNFIFMEKKLQLQLGHLHMDMIYSIHIKLLLGMNTLVKVELSSGMTILNGAREIQELMKKHVSF